MASGNSYSRVGVVRVPVSATSASNQFPFPDNLKGLPNLYFQMENLTPYDIRLEGTTANDVANGVPFRAVTANSGWPMPARQFRDPRVSKMPVFLSAAVFDTPGNPLPANADYTNCFLDLVYLQRV
jgi:hypothetical protein